jgi:hypothetical protein
MNWPRIVVKDLTARNRYGWPTRAVWLGLGYELCKTPDCTVLLNPTESESYCSECRNRKQNRRRRGRR